MFLKQNIPLTIILLLGFAGLANAQIETKGFLFNSAYDFLQGDTQEYTLPQDITRELKHFPPQYPIIGIGASRLEDWMGAVIMFGSVAEPRFLWTSFPTPHYVEPFPKEGELIWLDLAVCNPQDISKRQMRNVQDIPQFVAKEIQGLNYVRTAAVMIKGQFSSVEFRPAAESMGHWIAQARVASASATKEWTLYGFYFGGYEWQLAGSQPGSPLILFGLEKSGKRGGPVISAEVLDCEMSIYPLRNIDIFQSDLSVIAGRREDTPQGGEILKVRVRNDGRMRVRNVQVKAVVGGHEMEQMIPQMKGEDETVLEFPLPAKLTKPIWTQIKLDYMNQIWESREDNNTFSLWP